MIVVHNLVVRQGAFTLEGISFEIAAGRYAALMGRTGSGKTTILEAIAGLRPLHGGRILLDGRDVATLAPGERGIGYVPQDLALFTTMTVREHLAFSLRVHRWPQEKINPRVRELAELLGLVHLLNRKPHGLSGGESQRVALGRALAYHPRILLLDEPLSALDDATREEMYALLRRVQTQTGVTTLHVTHNRAEATALANDLILLENGTARQTGCNQPHTP